jgi:hypothetical protein
LVSCCVTTDVFCIFNKNTSVLNPFGRDKTLNLYEQQRLNILSQMHRLKLRSRKYSTCFFKVRNISEFFVPVHLLIQLKDGNYQRKENVFS